MIYTSPQTTVVLMEPDALIAESIGGGSEVFTDFGDSAEKITFHDVLDF